MKHYCHHCGKQIENGNKFCPHCGTLQDRYSDDYRYEEKENDYVGVDTSEEGKGKKFISENTKRELDTVVKVFMVISTVIMGIFIIPLFWMIPMTMHAWKKADSKEPYGLAFSIFCIFLFPAPPVSGICMIIRDSDYYAK